MVSLAPLFQISDTECDISSVLKAKVGSPICCCFCCVMFCHICVVMVYTAIIRLGYFNIESE